MLAPIPESARPGHRDSFHVNAVVVTCECYLTGGTYVRFTDNTYTEVEECLPSQAHGITDPFSPTASRSFWMVLKPEIATKVQHYFEINVDAEQSDLRRDCPGQCGD